MSTTAEPLTWEQIQERTCDHVAQIIDTCGAAAGWLGDETWEIIRHDDGSFYLITCLTWRRESRHETLSDLFASRDIPGHGPIAGFDDTPGFYRRMSGPAYFLVYWEPHPAYRED